MKIKIKATALTLAMAGGLLLVTGCTPDPLIHGADPGATPTPPSSAPSVVLDAQEGPPAEVTPAPTTAPLQAGDVPSPSLPAGKPGTARGQIDPRGVDRTSADQVAAAFGNALVAVDTNIDNRPNDAATRAATYATPELMAAMTASAPISNPDAAWTTLQAHHGWTSVVSTPARTARPDAPTEVWRAVTTTAQPHGEDAWTGTTTQLTWTVQLTRPTSTGPWQIAQYEESSR